MIITFAGQKGGSGKTTTSIAVAAELSRRGERVLLVDADPQASASTWADLAAELDVQAPATIAMGERMHRPEQLPAIADAFDHVVIDCPPRHGKIQRAALMLADLVIVPCGPSGLDAWALGETLDLIEEAQMVRPALQSRILVTRKIARTTIGEGARDVLAQSGHEVLKAELGYRVAYQEAPAAGLGVTSYDEGGKAADEVHALVDELLALAVADTTPAASKESHVA